MSNNYTLSSEEISKIILHSPYVLSDAPYTRGQGAGQIKKYFYDFIIYLAEKLNVHLDDVGSSVDSLDAAIAEINQRLKELHDADLTVSSLFNDSLSRHLTDLSAHADIREQLNDAKESMPKVYFESSFALLVSVCMFSNVKNGDILFNTETGAPDFIVFSVGQFNTSSLEILTEEMVYSNTLPVPKIGDKFLIENLDGGSPKIGIIAIESGAINLNVTADDALSDTSENPVQNKVVTKALSDIQNNLTFKEYEKIGTITVAPSEDGTLPNTIVFSLTGDHTTNEVSTGNEFELTDFYVKFIGSIFTEDTNTAGKVNLFVNNTSVLFGQASVGLLKHKDLRRWAVAYRSYGEDMGGQASYVSSTIAKTANFPNSNVNAWVSVQVPPNIGKSTTYAFNAIRSIKLVCSNASTEYFSEGTYIEVWGVRK